MFTVSTQQKEEVNKSFSDNALKMMKKRYLVPLDDGGQETPADMFERVAKSIASVEKNYGKDEGAVDKVAEDFFNIMSAKEYTPAGRTLTNSGGETPVVANCIVLPIHDSMESIFQTLKDAAMLQQAGCGLGFDLSEMRPAYFSTKKSRGKASGPVSFLKVYDAAFGTIKQQGRHGANMAMMRVDHPDILDFIRSKKIEGEIRNFNITVTVTDAFMEALKSNPDQKWMCTFNGKEMKPRDVLRHASGSVYDTKEVDITVQELFDELVESAWANGEPGIAFIDTINKSNPLPGLGPIGASNPCIPGDARIPTERGFLRMEELVKEYGESGIKIAADSRIPRSKIIQTAQKVSVGVNGEYQAHPTFSLVQEESSEGFAEKAWKTGVKSVYRLKTKSGYELEATKDHKIFTRKGKKPLSELVKGDKVLLQNQEGIWAKNFALPFTPQNVVKGHNGRIYQYNFPAHWSKELGQVLGWLIGDGWMRDVPKQYTVGFTFAEGDREVMTYFQKILNTWYRNSAASPQKRANGVYHLNYGAKDFVEYFKNLGVKPVRAEHKEIPESLWYAPREVIVGFIQGLFSADGTINISGENQTRYIRLSSKSERLCKQVQLLLSNLGIRSTIYNRSRGERVSFGYRNDGVLFELQISKTNTLLFLKKVGFLGNHYAQKADELATKRYYREQFEDEVAEIKYVGRKTVYDLTEQHSHSFIANGIVISNCGEQFLHGYDVCNLGSINLSAFVKDGKVNWERLSFVTRTATRLMDNVIDLFEYPVPQVTEMAQKNRRIGLGIMGFADMLFQLNIKYDSTEGIEMAEKVMGFIQNESHKMSQQLAKEKGVFPNYEKSVFTRAGLEMRNTALTTVAPTGSISMMFDVSSGIEPNFALAYIKQDKDGQQYNYLNKHFKTALDKLGLSDEEKKNVEEEIIKTGSIQHLTNLPKDFRKTFVVSMDISGDQHMRMQAAFQKHVDNSISKTINFPNSATKEEVAESFQNAWGLGCKSSTVYRDGSRTIQILNLGDAKDIVSTTEAPTTVKKETVQSNEKEVVQSTETESKAIAPRERPEVMVGKTYKIKTGYGKLYITINNDEKGKAFEIFATIGKSGGFFQEQSEAICRLSSMSLRSGVPAQEIVDSLKGIRGPMPVFTEKGTILSLPDAIGQVLEEHIGTMKEIEEIIERPENQTALPFSGEKSIADFGFMPGCPDCGSPLTMSEGCINCKSCGFSRCS